MRESRNDAWRRALETLDGRGHYLDDFLAEMKRHAHLALIERWGGELPCGTFLKTDLFEEAAGPDALLPALQGAASVVVGMDGAYPVVARARHGMGGARSLVGDARALPFRTGSFDLILSPSTLDHFEDPADLDTSLRELRRILKPAGRLIITLDNRHNVLDWLLRVAKWLRLVPYVLGRSYSIRELVETLEANGFDVLDRTAIIHHPRLFGVAAVRVTRALRWGWLTQLLRRSLRWAQRLGETRFRYFSGCFVAALARPTATSRGRTRQGT
jgi:SAM-dependent methyltransferase